LVIKKFCVDQKFDLTKEYFIKCHELKPLTPSVSKFEKSIKRAIEKSIVNKIPPIKIENMRNKYPHWFYFFNQWNIC
jgi:hypothetical protein